MPFQAVADAVAPPRRSGVQPLYQLSFNFLLDTSLEGIPHNTSQDDLSWRSPRTAAGCATAPTCSTGRPRSGWSSSTWTCCAPGWPIPDGDCRSWSRRRACGRVRPSRCQRRRGRRSRGPADGGRGAGGRRLGRGARPSTGSASHDDFFALGGHSLLAIRVVARLRRDGRGRHPIRALFAARHRGRLAAEVERLLAAEIDRAHRRGGRTAARRRRRRASMTASTTRATPGPALLEQRLRRRRHRGPADRPAPAGRASTRRCRTRRSGCGSWSSSRPGTAAYIDPGRRSGCGGGWTSDAAGGAGRARRPGTRACGCGSPPTRTAARGVRLEPSAPVPLELRGRRPTRPAAAARWSPRPRPSRSTWPRGPLLRACWSALGRGRAPCCSLAHPPHRRRRLVDRRCCWRDLARHVRALRRRAARDAARRCRCSTATSRPGSGRPGSAPRLDRGRWPTGGEHAAPGCRRWSCRPTGPARPPRPSPAPRTRFTLDRELTGGAARGSAARTGATLFMTLLAAYQALLSRYARAGRLRGRLARGRADRAGAGAAGRHVRQHAAAAGRPGRRPDRSPSCWPAPGRTVLDALAHQDVPFERLVDELERAPGREPVAAVPGAVRAAELRDARTAPTAPAALSPWQPVDAAGDPVRPGAARWYAGPAGLRVPVRLQHRPVRRRHRRSGWPGTWRRCCAPTVADPDRAGRDAGLLRSGRARRACCAEWNDTAADVPAGRRRCPG